MSVRKETSTNFLNKTLLSNFCGVVYALDRIGGRWKLLILYKLDGGRKRFSELRSHLPNISERMLTLQLKELQNDGLIERTVFAEVPVRVEYELTGLAKKLRPIWKDLEAWGEMHRQTMQPENSNAEAAR